MASTGHLLEDDVTIAPQVSTFRSSLATLTYDGRASILATLVALHSLENSDPDVTADEEAMAIASHAREVMGMAGREV